MTKFANKKAERIQYFTYTTVSWFTKIKPGIKSQFLVYHSMYIYSRNKILLPGVEQISSVCGVVCRGDICINHIIYLIWDTDICTICIYYIILWWRKFPQGVTIPAAQHYITHNTLHQYQYTSDLTLSFTSRSNIAATFCLSRAALIRHPLMM